MVLEVVRRGCWGLCRVFWCGVSRFLLWCVVVFEWSVVGFGVVRLAVGCGVVILGRMCRRVWVACRVFGMACRGFRW